MKATLRYLGAGGKGTAFKPFAAFLDSQGELEWARTTVAGHSCASYFAVLMAIQFPVQRMVMTGGVGGSLVGYDLDKLQVPPSERYGFAMSQSCGAAPAGSECADRCTACTASGSKACTYAQDNSDWAAMALPGQAGVQAKDLPPRHGNLAAALGGARQLFDQDVCVYPGRPIMTHLCEICDLQTHRHADGSPVLAPVWQYLVANDAPATPGVLVDNTTCNATRAL